jgi:hypothetical protein
LRKPDDEDVNYDTFLNALMEQINYFDLNEDIITYSSVGGAFTWQNMRGRYQN